LLKPNSSSNDYICRKKEGDYDKKESELTFAQLELKRKEELVQNLMSTIAELEGLLDSNKQIGRKISKKMSLVEKPQRKTSISTRRQKTKRKSISESASVKKGNVITTYNTNDWY